MAGKSDGIRVKSRDGEAVKEVLLSSGLLDTGKRASRCGDSVFFPVTEGELDLDELGISGEMVRREFNELRRKPRDVREALSSVLKGPDLSLVGSSYDIIGRIAVVELAGELEARAGDIGAALLEWLPVDTVAMKASPTSGQYRVRELRVIAGSETLETVHVENGLRFKLDLSKVFFNPRLSGERSRIAKSCRGSSRVIDMFAGVGSFSVNIDRECPGKGPVITAIDSNPHAYSYLVENARLNRAWSIVPVLGDSMEEVPRLAGKRGRADRIIMNLPKDSHRFLGTAAEALEESGIVHYYRLLPRKGAREAVEGELSRHGKFRVEVLREVEGYSPSRSIYVADSRLLARV